MATFTNQATLSYNGGTINSNVITGEIIEVLSATKTAITNSYSQGTETTYAINIVNSGNAAFNGLALTDNLGAYSFAETTLTPLDYVDGSAKFFVNGELQAAPVVEAGPPLTISGLTIPANSVATLLYVARANAFAPLQAGATIENTATINGGGITEITVSETISAAAEPVLTITKSLCPATVAENGQLTYTFLIQNIGNTEAIATDNVTITDIFNPILENISVTYNGTQWTTPQSYAYNQATGEFSTVPGAITVPPATYSQDQQTGITTVTPGTATITVTGTV